VRDDTDAIYKIGKNHLHTVRIDIKELMSLLLGYLNFKAVLRSYSGWYRFVNALITKTPRFISEAR
jgi:hypothetical protein